MKLIKLYATWCKPCVELAEMLAEHNISHESVDVDSLDGEGMVSKYNVKALPTLSVYDENGNIIKNFTVNKVNAAPGADEIAVYFGTFTKKVYNSIKTADANKVFVVNNPTYCLPNSVKDFYGLGAIETLSGGELKRGEFAICSNSAEVDSLLGEGVTIRVQYEWEGTAASVTNALNAGTQILVNGEAPSNVNTADGSRMNARHPRTAIGVKEDGTIVLMVNDGRQESANRYGSYGNELAAMMKQYGCVNAFNLDGGGSSIMYYRDGDKFVLGNKYSDASERSISNTVVVAVKDPEVSVEFDRIGSRDVEISVDVINANNHNLENLYARVGSKVAKVENGKAKITGLNPLEGYELQLSYRLGNDSEVSLATKYPFGTKAREYKIRDLEITDNGDSYLFALDYSDQAKATNLDNAKLFVNGKEYQLVDGKVTINKSDFEIITEIKLEFQNQIYQGYETVVVFNPHAPYLNALKDLLSANNQMIDDILK